jgi:hypothetical protein
MSATAAAVRSQHKRRALPWPLIWTVAVAAILWWGSHAHLERTLSPRSGVGYWLGILGGSLMLLLLIYSARKRFPWLHWIGGIPTWFEIHMTLGVVGPVLVLFHANFSLGATNSNVALFSMLLVSCSGVAGRYFYTRLHAHLDSHEETLEQLKAAGARLATQSTSSALLPGLLEAIERVEKRYIEPPRRPYLRLPHLLTGGIRLAIARWIIRGEAERAVKRAHAYESLVAAGHARRLAAAARVYARRRLDAGRRITEYRLYARLFSYWHVLHLPLFFMLLVAGFVHVVAINIY